MPRDLLAQYEGKRIQVAATAAEWRDFPARKGPGITRLLLKDVRSAGGEPLTDHVWLPLSGEVTRLGISILDARANREATINRRRRQCSACGGRWTTYEVTGDQIVRSRAVIRQRIENLQTRLNAPGHTGKIEGPTFVRERGGTRLMRSVIYARNMHGRAQNETEKPYEVVRPIHDYSVRGGGSVFIPFGGAGVDAEVAWRRGCSAVLCEIRESQAEATAKRLSALLKLPEAA